MVLIVASLAKWLGPALLMQQIRWAARTWGVRRERAARSMLWAACRAASSVQRTSAPQRRPRDSTPCVRATACCWARASGAHATSSSARSLSNEQSASKWTRSHCHCHCLCVSFAACRSQCAMRRAACARGTRLFVAHAGACEPDLYWRAVQRRAAAALERAVSQLPRRAPDAAPASPHADADYDEDDTLANQPRVSADI